MAGTASPHGWEFGGPGAADSPPLPPPSFCKDTFDKNYKATIGVDFEMERFEVLGVPFSLQL